MKMHAMAHRRDEVPVLRKAHASLPAAPTLQFASMIGNHRMRQLLAAPVVQRSLWDDVSGAVAEVTDWFGGGDAVQEPAPDVDAPMSDPNVHDDALAPSNEPAFENAQSPGEVREQQGANEAADEGAWFESWFGEQEAESGTGALVDEAPQAAQDSECAALESQISQLSEYIQNLYDQSQGLLPEVEAAKAQAEALERSAPGSAQAQEARQRFESLHQRYNAIVDECLYLMELRNGLRQQLEDCRAKAENKPKPMPDGFPCC